MHFGKNRLSLNSGLSIFRRHERIFVYRHGSDWVFFCATQVLLCSTAGWASRASTTVVQCSQTAWGGVPVQQQPSAARWRRPAPARLIEHTRNKQAEKHGRKGQGNGDETSLEHVPQIDTEAVSAQKLHFYDVCVLIAPTLSPPGPQMSCMRPS